MAHFLGVNGPKSRGFARQPHAKARVPSRGLECRDPWVFRVEFDAAVAPLDIDAAKPLTLVPSALLVGIPLHHTMASRPPASRADAAPPASTIT
jgi:hypothetical protein